MLASAVASMHEEVDDWAEQKEGIRERAEDVRLVLFPQEEERDRQEETEPQPDGNSEGRVLWFGLRFALHVDVSLLRRHSFERRDGSTQAMVRLGRDWSECNVCRRRPSRPLDRMSRPCVSNSIRW